MRRFGNKKRTVRDRRTEAILFLTRVASVPTREWVAQRFGFTLKVADEVLEKCGRGGE